MTMTRVSKKKMETITTTTTEILTTDERMIETIAMLELSSQFSVEDNCKHFVNATKMATQCFAICGDYIKVTAMGSRIEHEVKEHRVKVAECKRLYEEALREEQRLMDQSHALYLKSREMKNRLGDAFVEASEAWKSDEW